MEEISRQMIHLSGLVFVLFSFVIDKNMISICFFMIAFSLLFYSIFIRRQQNIIIEAIHKLETSFKYLVNKFERQRTRTPFIGAFWFYFSCGLVLLIFPIQIAVVSCSILAVSDSVSTLVGMSYGKRKIIGSKTMEGSLGFFISALIVAYWFTNFWVSLLAAFTATIAELLPELSIFRKLREKELLDDNLTVPVITGFLLLLVL